MLLSIPCAIYRGGSSKGVFFLGRDLPESKEEQAILFQKILGGNDPKQIDGLGGAQIVTSKVAVVERSDRADCDVDYTFVQVYPNKPGVDLSSNCGNISSAVGLFAMEKGLVRPTPDATVVRVFNTNTGKVIEETLQTPGGKPCVEGNYAIAGVPGTGSRIELAFQDPGGAVTGRLLPTGRARESVRLTDGREIDISVVDCTGLFVFAPMAALGLTGQEDNAQLEQNPSLLRELEQIRGTAAVRLGLAESAESAAEQSAAIPKLALVGAPAAYRAGKQCFAAEEMDLRVCMMTLGKPHKSFAVTGAMCVAGAAAIPGSVVHGLHPAQGSAFSLRLGNPAGIMETGVRLGDAGEILSALAYRTARLLMSGAAYYITEESKS